MHLRKMGAKMIAIEMLEDSDNFKSTKSWCAGFFVGLFEGGAISAEDLEELNNWLDKQRLL